MDNTVKALRYEIKFENRVRDKNKFFIKRKIFLFKTKIYFFYSLRSIFVKISKNLIASAFFLPRQILQNIDMPRQKPRHLGTAEANFERWAYMNKRYQTGILTSKKL